MKIKNSRLCILMLVFVFAIPSFAGYPVGNAELSDLERMQKKYPLHSVVHETMHLDVTIEMVNGTPLVTRNEYSSKLVLTDHATSFADAKEFFNPEFVVEKFEAYTMIKDDRKAKKLLVNNLSKTSESGSGIYYDDMMAYTFTFPSVVKGARLVTHSISNCANARLPVFFFFGDFIPVDDALIRVTVDKSVEIDYKLFGYDTEGIRFSKKDLGDQTLYQWEGTATKGYISDVLAPSVRYYMPHLIVKIKNYSDQGKTIRVLDNLDDLYKNNYSNLIGLNENISQELKELTDSLVKEVTPDREKVRRIFKWVQRNIKYVAIEDGSNAIVPRQADLVFQRRYGDCKDKTSILIAMLKSQGIRGSYAWIGSRDLPYKYSDFPSVHIDNHMVAVWWDENDNPVVLDGTTQHHRMEDVPAFIQGKECLIEKGPDHYMLHLIPVAVPESNFMCDSLVINLNGDTVSGYGKAVFTGELRAEMMRRFDGKDTSGVKDAVTRYIPKASNKFIVNRANTSEMDHDQPFVIHYWFMIPDYLVSSGTQSYINLNIDRFYQNLVIKPDRWIPIEAENTNVRKMVCVLNLPDHMKVGLLPEPVVYSDGLTEFQSVFSSNGNQVILTTLVKINFQLAQMEQIALFRNMLLQLNKAYMRSFSLTKK